MLPLQATHSQLNAHLPWINMLNNLLSHVFKIFSPWACKMSPIANFSQVEHF